MEKMHNFAVLISLCALKSCFTLIKFSLKGAFKKSNYEALLLG